MNKRRFTRVVTDFEVDLCFAGGREVSGQLKNLSIFGMFVEAESVGEIGERCLVVFFPNGRADAIVVELEGLIARVGDGGLGIKLEDMSEAAFEQLVHIVISSSDDPSLIRAEVENELRTPLGDGS